MDDTKEQFRKDWERGTPLDNAWIDHAKFFDRFAYQALHTHPDNDADVLDVQSERYHQLTRGWLPTTWEGRQKKLQITTRNERIQLLDNIYQGHLIALGCRTQPDGSDLVVQVPREYFFVDYQKPPHEPEIDWPKGELRTHDGSYFDIRVIDPGQVAVPDKSLEKEQHHRSSRSGGRPNSKRKIQAVAMRLLEDPAFKAKSRQEQAMDVREQIYGTEARKTHDYPGMKTETIKRYLGEIDND